MVTSAMWISPRTPYNLVRQRPDRSFGYSDFTGPPKVHFTLILLNRDTAVQGKKGEDLGASQGRAQVLSRPHLLLVDGLSEAALNLLTIRLLQLPPILPPNLKSVVSCQLYPIRLIVSQP